MELLEWRPRDAQDNEGALHVAARRPVFVFVPLLAL